MTETEINTLSEKKRELDARIDLMDDPTMGTEDAADELREEREELEKYTPDGYRLTQDLFVLRDERDALTARLERYEDPVFNASEDHIEEIRDDRADVIEKMKKKQNELRTKTAMKNVSEITGGSQ